MKINKETYDLYAELKLNPLLNDFVMIGGTALSLHINHRNSLDIDLVSLNEKLPTYKIDSLINELKLNHVVQNIRDVSRESAFKINTGKKLNDYARDYLIDGVKLTFFCETINQNLNKINLLKSKIENPNGLSLCDLDGLKILKSIVLEDRVKSRDIYDLMILFKDYDYSYQQFKENIQAYSKNNTNIDYFDAVLTGEIPIDKDDEGLYPVGVSIEIKKIYEYFKGIVYKDQILDAKKLYKNKI